MNKYCDLNKEELLEICNIIHPHTNWKLYEEIPKSIDDFEGKYKFMGSDNSIIEFDITPFGGGLKKELEPFFQEKILFSYKGDKNNKTIADKMVRYSEHKINDYLFELFNKNQDSENKNLLDEDYNFTEDEIKSLLINIKGTDKFTKVEEYESKPIYLNNDILKAFADAKSGKIDLDSDEYKNLDSRNKLNIISDSISSSFRRSSFILTLNLIYKKRQGDDILILKIATKQHNPTGRGYKTNLLNEGKILFLFDNKDTLSIDKVIKYQDGINENLYLETDISFLTQIINSHQIDYRVSGENGIISENELLINDVMNFIGFYNVLFDNTFMKEEIVSFLKKEKKKALILKLVKEKNAKRHRQIMDLKEIQRKRDLIDKMNKRFENSQESSSSSCFVVTATMKDPKHPIVNDYRLYRDKYLLNNKAGLQFIKFYYFVGPYLAKLINNSETLRKISFNTFVRPLHKLIQKKIDTSSN